MPEPDPELFLSDLEAKPAALGSLAGSIDDLWPADLDRVSTRVVIGMGSSRSAGSVFATRWQRRGIPAWAEHASATDGRPPGPGALVIGISASGTTPETVDALDRHRGQSRTVAIANDSGTNDPGSPLSQAGDITIPMLAGQEAGGVACRTYQHTLAVLFALDHPTASSLVRRVAEATEDLLERRDEWLPAAADILAEGPATFAIAPVERMSSAEQAALMFREGPRRTADACEAGDWLHVDVYLTKPIDYRAIVFTGSRFEPAIMGWMDRRGGRVVAVGGAVDGAAACVRYRHDHDPDVALLTEVLVAELVAATWWGQGRSW